MPDQTKTYPDDLSLSKSDTTARFRCFPDISENPTDTVISVAPTFEPKKEKLSDKPKSLDAVFILFLVCFLIASQAFGKSGKMLISMLEGLFRTKERKSIFTSHISNELYSKFLLIFQTCTVLSIFIYCRFTHDFQTTEIPLTKTLLIIGGSVLLIGFYFLYKWLAYIAVGKVFFNKESLTQWMENFTSLMCITGIIIFIPVLLMFYIPSIYTICYFFVTFCLILIAIIVIYRTIVLFFHNIRLLLHLFLYLCAQEIVPLIILYAGLVSLFNLVEKNTLWL